jgi:hypothetical protein
LCVDSARVRVETFVLAVQHYASNPSRHIAAPPALASQGVAGESSAR